jgi:AraC-like DNA-binding protein
VVEYPNVHDLNVVMVDIDYCTPHIHEDIEIILILKGSIISSSMRKEVILKADSAAIYNSYQPHEFLSTGEGVNILCLQISPRFCAHYFPAINMLNFDALLIENHLSPSDFAYSCALMIEIAYQYFARKPGFEFSCISMLNQLFWILIRSLPSHTLSEDEKKSTTQRTERLGRILNYIDEHYTEKVLLSDIASREHLSMTYLSHFIAEHFNLTFQEYVNELRFSLARKLLAEKDAKAINVCMQSGFSDYRYFYKTFIKNTGLSPREFQKKQAEITLERRYRSTQSMITYYTVEETFEALEVLHHQNIAFLRDYPNPLMIE